MKYFPFLLIVVITAGTGFARQPGVVYNGASNILWVTGYPERAPCTPAELIALDRTNGWGKVTYDATSDTVTVNCHLWIGTNNNTDTYFQLGSRDHPKETLIVRGNVEVKPYWLQGVQAGAQWWVAANTNRRVNRLTLGVDGHTNVRATLLIDNGECKGWTLRIGQATDKTHGGECHVFNSVVSAAGDRPECYIGANAEGNANSILLCGRKSIILKNAVISKTAKTAHMAYGLDSRYDGAVSGSVFQEGGVALSRFLSYVKGCAFIGCDTAIAAPGGFHSIDDAVFDQCVFRGNRCNWNLCGGKGFVMVDCDLGAAPDDICRAWKKEGQETVYPRVMLKRHIIVKVIDESGRPLDSAEVKIIPEPMDPEAGIIITQTGVDGMTPGRDAGNAILLCEQKITATEVADQPEIKVFSWTIRAGIEWLKPAELKGFQPRKSWELVTLVLKK